MLLAYKGKADEKETAWFLDSGTNDDMCGQRNTFTEPDESVSVSFLEIHLKSW